ncbi:MAG: hypothetical protein WC023_09180 [Rhodocyclaceae bacterium]
MTEPNESSALPNDPGLSRLYHSATDEVPPAALDAAILKLAREALAAQPVPLPWWKRLRLPVAVAASMLLAVMLSLTMQGNPSMVQEVAPPPSLPAAGVPATKGATDPASMAKEAVPPPAVRSERRAKAVESAPVGDRTAPAPISPSPEGRLAAPAAKAESTNAADSAVAERPRTMQPAVPTMAPAGAGAPAPMLESAAKRAVPRPEAVWLDEIRELRRQGKQEEAARRLAAFRTAYPDYPLPDDLK